MNFKTKLLLFIILVISSILAYYVLVVHYLKSNCELNDEDESDEILSCRVENNRAKRYIQGDEMEECSFPDKEYLNMTTLYKTVEGTILIQEVIASIAASNNSERTYNQSYFKKRPSSEQMTKLNAYGYGREVFEGVTDQRGHLVASRFGGEAHHLYNMSPQKPNLNQPNQLYVDMEGQNHGNE